MIVRSIATVLLGAGAAVASGATQPESTIYISGDHQLDQRNGVFSTSWDSAIPILAYRLGLSDAYEASKLTDDELELARALKTSDNSLLDDRLAFKSKALVIIEDVEKMQHSALLPVSSPAFTAVGSHPASSQLLDFFQQQHSSLDDELVFDAVNSGLCADLSQEISDYTSTLNMDDSIKTLLAFDYTSDCTNGYFGAVRVSGLKRVSAAFGESSSTYQQALQVVTDYLVYITSIVEEKTFVLAPFAPHKPLRSFAGLHAQSRRNLKGRQDRPEAPLSDFADSESTSSGSSTATSSTASPTATESPIRNVTLAKGLLLPSCFPQKATAIKMTKNCTGRGVVYQKYKAKDPKEEVDCWACKCGSTYRLVESGARKTTYWAGAACQKEDISSPFFLIAGFTILLVGLVSWGIGMLFSIGQETLPGVIGAGVAGPRASK